MIDQEDRNLIPQALKAAKPYLSTTAFTGRKEQFICYALIRARDDFETSHVASGMAIDLIMKRLGLGNRCVETWLSRTIGYEAMTAALRANPNVVQEYRHRWLDALIKEFSA